MKNVAMFVRNFSGNDLKFENTTLIYFYDTIDGYSCEACEQFKDTVDTIKSVDVISLNYWENQEIAFRFFVYYVPQFFIIDKQRVYAINPDNELDLLEIIEKRLWKDVEPLKWYFEPGRMHIRLISKFFYISYFIYEYLSKYYSIVPTYVIYVIYGIILVYLVNSIKDIVNEIYRDLKLKNE